MPTDGRKDKNHKRKSKGSIDAGEDSITSSGSATEEKGAKKRSGVFSGLFSRNKDKKERKSGSFSSAGGGDDSSMLARNSEDIENYKQREAAAAGAAGHISGAASPSSVTGMGRTVQERDRAQQEAYSRQFLGNGSSRSSAQESFTARNGSGKPRPGSLMGTPNTVPMLNVMRLFAGDDIESDATFKTVLLNDLTSTRDLMRQAMQRFRLPQVPGGYVLTVKSLEGIERSLGEDECPLKVFDSLSEMGPEAHTMPSVKRSSVGSISSISSNLSLNPAIARAHDDFSDDHAVKFYLRRRLGSEFSPNNVAQASAARIGQAQAVGASADAHGDRWSQASASMTPSSSISGTSTDGTVSLSPTARFALRLLIFPSDLPDGLVFDPQTPALVPESVLAERGPNGAVAADGVEQRYREKVLSLPRNATVAEVIESGLDRFGIAEGVVEGGDDVEDRTTRRRSKPRVKYGLAVEVRRVQQQQRQERPLAPTSKVLDAFPAPPLFRSAPTSNKRRSADSTMLLSMAEEQLRPEDPVFILRVVGANGNASRQHGGLGHGHIQGHHYPGKSNVRSLSPSEGRLADRQDQRRQEELSNVRAPVSAEPTPRSLIAAQRAAAQERKAAVLGAQRNDQQGVDLYLVNDAKIRSSRSLEGKVRYSYLPGLAGSEELDISAIVEDVLADQESQGGSSSLRPTGPWRDPSTTTLNSFQSAPSTPIAQSPIELSEANIDYVGGSHGSATAPLSVAGKTTNRNAAQGGANRDLLEGFVRNTQNSESTIEHRIDQVLSRVAGGGATTTPTLGKGGSAKAPSSVKGPTGRQASGGSSTTTGTHRQDQSSFGSEELSSSMQDSPRSASTNPTPVSTLGIGGAGIGTGVGALVVGSGAGLSAGRSLSPRSRSAPGSTRIAHSTPAAYIPSDDFGLDHLYTIVDAAMRRDPKKYTRVVVQPPQSSSGSATPPSSKHNSTVMTLAPRREPFRSQVAGLFGPNEDVTMAHASSRAVYGPIKGQLDRIEDGLDSLLLDVQRLL